MLEEDESIHFLNKQQVEFIDICDEYQILEDIKFTIKLNDYKIQEGDRIAIYKIGWKKVQDYEIFDWAPTNTIVTEIPFYFKGSVLPKNHQSLYQICYINGENKVKGASTPFHIHPFKLSVNTSYNHFTDSELSNINQTILQDNKQKMIQHHKDIESYLIKILEMVNNCISHQQTQSSDIINKQDMYIKLISDQQNEIRNLKSRVTKMEEEYKKLYAEKTDIQKKYNSLKESTEVKNLKTNQNLKNIQIDDCSESGTSNEIDLEYQSFPEFPAISSSFL